MPVIKTALMKSIVDTYTLHNKVLQYTSESTKSKAERLISACNKILNVL